jgi:hypothetical protein
MRSKPTILVALLLAAFLVNLDTTLVNVALPAMVRELHATTTQLQWVVDSFNLVFAALLLTFGSLRPRLLIHGHTTLTENFTAEAVPGLQAALTQLHGEVLDGIRGGRALPDILAGASLPAVLREHPTAVVPYLVTRDHFTERLYHQRTGYWQPDLRGLEPATGAEHAAALDLLAAGREQQFAAAAATLISQGDHALALQTIIEPGLLRHPASTTLAGLRATALHRLMEACQQLDPFKFLIYADLAGAEIGPVQ